MQQIQASGRAFSAILGDGSVVTWGAGWAGGESSAVQTQLKNVQQVHTYDFSFVAILDDGSTVAWGHASLCGDSSAVQHVSSSTEQDPCSIPENVACKC